MTLTERLREKISQAFYNHGLLCASYPIPIILFTGLCILACWYVFSLPYVVEECGEMLDLTKPDAMETWMLYFYVVGT